MHRYIKSLVKVEKYIIKYLAKALSLLLETESNKVLAFLISGAF